MLWVEQGVNCAAPVNKCSVAVTDVLLIVRKRRLRAIVEIFFPAIPGCQQQLVRRHVYPFYNCSTYLDIFIGRMCKRHAKSC